MAILLGLGACAVAGMNLPLSVMTVAAVGILVAWAGHPAVAALAMTAAAVLDGHAADSLQPTLSAVTGGLWRYNTIGYALALTTLLGLEAVLRRGDLHSRLMQALAAVMAVTLLWSPDRANGLQLLLDVVAFFGMLCVFDRMSDDREAWYWIGITGGTLAAGAGLAYLMNRARLPNSNPNVAVFVPLTGMVAVCLAFARGALSPARQYGLAGLAIVNLLWAFLSTSRGGLLTATACFAFIVLQVRSTGRRVVILAGVVLIGLLLASYFTPLQQTAVQRLSLLFDRSAALQTRTSGRSDLVKGSWEIFMRHPFGVGTGGFETTWATLGSVDGQRTFMRSGQRFAAHAGWMRMLAENGFIGFGILAAFVGSFAVAGFRRGGPTARNLGLLAAAGLGLSLVSTEYHLKGLFFLAAGVAAALRAIPPGDGAAPTIDVRRPLTLVRGAGEDHP